MDGALVGVRGHMIWGFDEYNDTTQVELWKPYPPLNEMRK